LKERNAAPLQELAIAQTKAGMDFIDINIGRRVKTAINSWNGVVKTVQEVTDLPLSLDTTNPLAMEAGLKAHRGKRWLNSFHWNVWPKELPLAVKYDCDFVGLLWQRRLAARRQ